MKVNAKKTKMMINRENAGKVTVEGQFPSAVWRKSEGRHLQTFCSCSVLKRCSGVRGKLKEDRKFRCEACGNQQKDIEKHCPGI